MAESAFSVGGTVRRYPRLPYKKMRDDVLGASYSLSLVFVGPARAQALNRAHRKKMYVPNVLSFSLDRSTGEIFITPAVAEREARQRGMSVRGYIGFLFIHGLLHLKGVPHGDTMEMLEKRYCKKYRLQ